MGTPLTSSRHTDELGDGARELVIPVEAAKTIYLGSIVAVNAAGNAVPASDAGALRCVGRAERVHNGIPGQDAVNVSPVTSGAAGAISIVARRGVFQYDNDGSISQANVDQMAYAADDHTVAADETVVAPAAATIPATGTLLTVLAHRAIKFGSVIVQSSDGLTTYIEGTDYYVNYQGGVVFYIGGTLVASTNIKLGYTYHAGAGKPVAGRIVGANAALTGAFVDFWHKADSVL